MKKLMVLVALLVFTAGSAYAAEWNFYGSARISTFYSSYDNNPFIAGNPNTSDYEHDLNGNARIGANVKVSDELTGRFEYGAKNGSVNLRILWGEWNFGAGSLGIGQHYTPLLMPYSNQVYNIYPRKDGDTNMSLFGMLYGKREPMIRLKFGNFQIAAVAPRTTVSVASMAPLAQPSVEAKLPNIQAKYKFDFDWGHINAAGGYQTYEVVATGGQDYSVTSYVLALGGRVNAGKFYFKGNIWGGENVGNLADILTGGNIASTMAGATGGDLDGTSLGFALYNDGTIPGSTQGIVDNEALAGLIVAGVEIRKGLYLEGGYGYTRTEFDMAGSTKQDAHTFYLQSTIFLAPGVFLTPEIGMFDGQQAGDPEIKYAGIKWQINF